MTNCVVSGCCGKTSADDSIRLYKFPQDKLTRIKWLENIGLQPGDLKSMSKVCSRHFESGYLGFRRLKPRVIPTLCLGHEHRALHRNTVPFQWKRRNCCIKNCNSGYEKRFFKVPPKGEQRRTWLSLCKLDNSTKKYLYICANHFNENAIGKRKLLKGAVPSRNLSLNDNVIVKTEKVNADAIGEDTEASENGSVTNSCLSEQIIKNNLTMSCAVYKTEDLEDYTSEIELCPHGCHRNFLRKEKKLLAEIIRQNEEIVQLKDIISVLKQRFQNLENSSFIANANTSEEAIAFSKMICGGRKKKFGEDEKILAQNIFSISSKCYNFMRSTLKFNLPHKSSVDNWCSELPMSADSNEIIFEQVFIPKDLDYEQSNNNLDNFVLNRNKENEMGPL
uniref:THAP-type domain-containing protein n=1 Tax=Glossina morsitans morsitans TaxID=37546 RepID=A0ABK9NGF2_GLOMM